MEGKREREKERCVCALNCVKCMFVSALASPETVRPCDF